MNDTQERIVTRLIQEPEVHRADVTPMADKSIEVRLYGAENRPLRTVTIFSDGNVGVRHAR